MDWSHLFMSGDGSGGNPPSTVDTGVAVPRHASQAMNLGCRLPKTICPPLRMDSAEQGLLISTSNLFENLPLPLSSASLPQRPPSIPPDLEPAPLFSPKLTGASGTDSLQEYIPFQFTFPDSQINSQLNQASQQQQQQILHQQQFRAAEQMPLPQQEPQLTQSSQLSNQTRYFQQQQQQQHNDYSRPGQLEGSLLNHTQQPPPIDTSLFDTNEEAYLQSFLNSFDTDGFDLNTYLTSPQPMPNFSTRSDLTGMGMGMGIGAGVMGAMDDSIPHLSLHNRNIDPSHVFSNMDARHTQSPNPPDGRRGSNTGQQYYDYGLNGSSNLSLGHVMSEELQKVSTWLLQNQDHHTKAPIPPSASFAGLDTPPSHGEGSRGQLRQAPTFNLANSSSANHPNGTEMSSDRPILFSATPASSGTLLGPENSAIPYPKPTSESDLAIKRKASYEQLERPRKNRSHARTVVQGPVSSIMDVEAGDKSRASGSKAGQDESNSPQNSAHKLESASDDNNSGSKKEKSKKAIQRIVLTEEERRANHIASEQRRRNQIRQGYAELMSLVTTLRDPALGNHPGTAQSTPSKAVILSHAVQFIRGLEEGNRVLRKRLEGTHHIIHPMHITPQHLAAFRPRNTSHTPQ